VNSPAMAARPMVVAGDVVVPTRSGSILLVEGDCPTKGGTNAEDLSSYVSGVASPAGRENKRSVGLRQPFSQQRIPVGDNLGTPMRSNKLTVRLPKAILAETK
jgi:hypothetical protein